MPARRSLLDRLLSGILGRRRGPRVLLLVNTTHGQRTVAVRAADLR